MRVRRFARLLSIWVTNFIVFGYTQSAMTLDRNLSGKNELHFIWSSESLDRLNIKLKSLSTDKKLVDTCYIQLKMGFFPEDCYRFLHTNLIVSDSLRKRVQLAADKLCKDYEFKSFDLRRLISISAQLGISRSCKLSLIKKQTIIEYKVAEESSTIDQIK